MKLSEVIARLNDQGINIDELEDDVTGRPMKDLRHTHGEYTKATQKLGELDRKAKELEGTIEQYKTAIEQWKAYGEELKGQIVAATKPAPAGSEDWEADPFYKPLVGVRKSLMDELRKSTEVITYLGNAMTSLINDYKGFKNEAMQFRDTYEIKDVSGRYKDFDREKVESLRKQRGGSWEDNYLFWRGQNAETIAQDAEKRGREAALAEANERSKAPAPTEMGSQPASPTPSGAPKSYDQAWGDLAKDLATLGVGSA